MEWFDKASLFTFSVRDIPCEQKRVYVPSEQLKRRARGDRREVHKNRFESPRPLRSLRFKE